MKKLAFLLIFSIFCITNLYGNNSNPIANQKEFNQLKSQGAAASMTILPTTLGPNANEKVGMVVGIMLEKCGMKKLDFNKIEFNPSNADFRTSVSEFSSFVTQSNLQTDYVFYSRIIITDRSISETWSVVANKEGEIVWADQQSKNDKAFKKVNPSDPMSTCVFLTDRFRSHIGLDPMDENVPAGKIEKMSNKADGLPSEEERTLIKRRAEQFTKKFTNSTMVVYPPLILETQVNQKCAQNLADLLNEQSLCSASVAKNCPVLEFDKSKPGQPAMLWSVARGFQQTIRADKISADYALYAHYGYFADRNKAGFIHFIVCDKNGDWVLTDIANSHHKDFQKMDWQTVAACDEFVVNRIAGYVNKFKE